MALVTIDNVNYESDLLSDEGRVIHLIADLKSNHLTEEMIVTEEVVQTEE